VEIATLYNQTGQPQKALDYMLSRRFHPWEGGTGRISRQYVKAHLSLGREALEEGDARTALSHFETAQATYPENLGERKHLRWPDADVHTYTGLARQALGDDEGARESFEIVLKAQGDDVSEASYYQALALRALGREDEAEAKLRTMLEAATGRLEEQAEQGFATSVPEFVFAEEDLETRRRVHLHYTIGLALMGLGETEKARAAFEQVLDAEPNHVDARARLAELPESSAAGGR
jgi:tetratricopeptide (TPR) repeat protein